MQTSAIPSSTQNEQTLQLAASQLSSGKRIASAAVDPSGLAIANALIAQAGGFDQGASNAQDAIDTSTVASGAIATISDAAKQLSTLSVAANNGLLSASDRADLQTEANQATQAINSTASSAQFNGLPLADGSTPTISVQTGASEGNTSRESIFHPRHPPQRRKRPLTPRSRPSATAKPRSDLRQSHFKSTSKTMKTRATTSPQLPQTPPTRMRSAR